MEPNTNYYKSVAELLKDEKFLQWRLLQDEEADFYWQQLQNQYPFLQKNIAEADAYLKVAFKKQRLTDDEKAALWQRIIQLDTFVKKRKVIPLWLRLTAAASILIIAGFVLLRLIPHKPTPPQSFITGNRLPSEKIQLITSAGLKSFEDDIEMTITADGLANIEMGKAGEKIAMAQNTLNKLIIPYGKRSRIQLADGTKIWLNSGSVIEFPSVFAANERKIKLSGEIYIEVAKNVQKPFFVQTPQFDVQVLGTKFNVSSYDKTEKSVTLVEGSVSLQSGTSNMKLTPSYKAICKQGGKFETKKVNTLEYTSWKDGYIILNKTPVLQVLKYVERYYNLSFNYASVTSLNSISCEGKLYLSDNLDNVMNVIALLSSTSYVRVGNTIYFKNKNRE